MLDKDQITYDRFPKSDKDLFFRGYQISCAQLCGNSHYSMKGYMMVHDPDDFENWLEEVETLFPLEEEEEW